MVTNIKLATETDLEIINHILRLSKSYWGYDKQFMDRFMNEFRITPEHLHQSKTYLFYVDEKLAGYFGFILTNDGQLELDNFFLYPDYIGKGLGRRLWQYCCETAQEMGRDEFILWGDPHAEKFYLKMGCEKIGMRPSPVLPNRFAPVFKYQISHF